MKDIQFTNLVSRYTKTQENANNLYAKIIDELDKRKLIENEDVLSCLNITEPQAWEQVILKLIKKDE